MLIPVLALAAAEFHSSAAPGASPGGTCFSEQRSELLAHGFELVAGSGPSRTLAPGPSASQRWPSASPVLLPGALVF
jgi:hypothetical protein